MGPEARAPGEKIGLRVWDRKCPTLHGPQQGSRSWEVEEIIPRTECQAGWEEDEEDRRDAPSRGPAALGQLNESRPCFPPHVRGLVTRELTSGPSVPRWTVRPMEVAVPRPVTSGCTSRAHVPSHGNELFLGVPGELGLESTQSPWQGLRRADTR